MKERIFLQVEKFIDFENTIFCANDQNPCSTVGNFPPWFSSPSLCLVFSLPILLSLWFVFISSVQIIDTHVVCRVSLGSARINSYHFTLQQSMITIFYSHSSSKLKFGTATYAKRYSRHYALTINLNLKIHGNRTGCLCLFSVKLATFSLRKGRHVGKITKNKIVRSKGTLLIILFEMQRDNLFVVIRRGPYTDTQAAKRCVKMEIERNEFAFGILEEQVEGR